MGEDFHFVFEAIGTHWSIDIFDIGSNKKEDIESLVYKKIDLFDKTYSRFRDDSLISLISKQKGRYKLPKDAKKLFDLYEKLYRITSGLFTPLIGNTLSDAGYDAKYSLKPKKLKNPSEWDEVLDYNFPDLTIKKPILLDFGAAGKGYIIDLVGALLEKQNIRSYCIDAGGDMLYKNVRNKPLRVGLENPADIKQVIGVCEIMNTSICGSSGNRRAWANFHHIINPKTLLSPTHIQAVWAIAKSTLISDALSTALFFVEPEILEKEYEFDFLILYKDFTIKKSRNFACEIYYT